MPFHEEPPVKNQGVFPDKGLLAGDEESKAEDAKFLNSRIRTIKSRGATKPFKTLNPKCAA
jgi:hypothetical protein